jgi:hypothetical protein
MVLRYMRIFKGLFIFVFFIFCFSCEQSPLFIINCGECVAEEPLEAELDMKLDSKSNNNIEINIYEGELSDKIIFANFRTSGNSTSFKVPLNKKFTVTATYYVGQNTYIVVDTAFPRVKYDKRSCDNPCYYVYNRKVNLRLKYE